MISTAAADGEDETEHVPGTGMWYVSITDFPRGLGSTGRALSMCQALGVAGYRPRLLIPYALGHGKNDQVEGTWRGVTFEYLNRSTTRPATPLRVGLAKFRGNLTLVGRMVRRHSRPSAIIFNTGSIMDCWGMLAAGRWLGIPTVLDMTDEWYDPSIPVQSLGTARYVFQRFTKATEELVYRSASRIIVVSRHLQRRLVSHAAKTIRCPMAFDPRVFQQAEPTRLAPADQFVVLYAGSVSRIEGIDLLLGAMRRLRPPEGRPARLFVVGNPAHSETIDQYKTAAGELLAGGLVTFAPAVDRERYASLLRGADLLVIPRPTSVASQAGFPYKLVEYIASGVPVLVTRFGDVEEYFANDVHCLMVDPNDPGPLAAGIELAMRHPDRMGMLARQGQARVQELFSFDTVAAQLRQLIESAAATTRQ